MSQEEINKLSEEEQDLARKLEELRQKKAVLVQAENLRRMEEVRRREMEKAIRVEVLPREGGNLLCRADSRPDLLDVWRSVPGRYFRSPNMNLIPIKVWDETLRKLEALPNLEVVWMAGVREELDWYLNAPTWKVEIEGRRGGLFVTAKPGPETNRSIPALRGIPGATWDYEAEDWTFPQSEAWRVFRALENIVGVVYSKEANELILAQIEKRAKLDAIAKRVVDFDAPLSTMFPGFSQPGNPPARHFQGHAAEFVDATDGKTLVAADTGLGKTWITLLWTEKYLRENPTGIVVINVPAAVIPNWEREIQRLTGRIPFTCSNYHKVPIQAMKELQFFRGKNFNYFIISHDTLGSYEDGPATTAQEKDPVYMWQMYFMQAQVDVLVVDEGHKLKNPETHRFRAIRPLAQFVPHRIILTATPILNRTSELWTQLHILDPIMFNSYKGFIDRYTWDGKTPKDVEKLHELLRPMSLRIKKQDVIKDFPEVNRIEVIHELSEDAQERYNEALQGLYRRLALFDPRGNEHTTEIHHILHQFNALKQICAGDKVDRIVEDAQQIMDEQNGEAGEKKMLIFSHWRGVAYDIARKLGSEAVCTVGVNANGEFYSMNNSQRDELFESIRNDKRIKYIVTTEASGTGMNLEFCWWTIFADPFWTPAGHKQCEGRSQRISNLHPIDAFYYRANTDIERWNFELLIDKMEIIDATVDSVEMTRDVSGSVLMELVQKVKESMWEQGIRG